MRISDFENKKVLNITNENDLQIALVKILKRSDLLFSCTHTDDMLDSDSKRIDACRNGYTVGMPDLMIYNGNNNFCGMAIELKNSWGTGVVSSQQDDILKKLEDQNWLILVSNDLIQIAETIILYKNNLIDRPIVVDE